MDVRISDLYKDIWKVANELADKEVRNLPGMVEVLMPKEDYIREYKLTPQQSTGMPDMVVVRRMSKAAFREERKEQHLGTMIVMFGAVAGLDLR